jgi:hypothetical protein
MTSEEDLWEIPNHLVEIGHERLLTPGQEKDLAPVSRVVFGAGLVGRAGFPAKPTGRAPARSRGRTR